MDDGQVRRREVELKKSRKTRIRSTVQWERSIQVERGKKKILLQLQVGKIMVYKGTEEKWNHVGGG